MTEPEALITALSLTLGIETQVSKRRALHMWHGVRIHLDEVEGLGPFVEFEAPVADDHDLPGATDRVARLRHAFEIDETDLVAASYCDLM